MEYSGEAISASSLAPVSSLQSGHGLAGGVDSKTPASRMPACVDETSPDNQCCTKEDQVSMQIHGMDWEKHTKAARTSASRCSTMATRSSASSAMSSMAVSADLASTSRRTAADSMPGRQRPDREGDGEAANGCLLSVRRQSWRESDMQPDDSAVTLRHRFGRDVEQGAGGECPCMRDMLGDGRAHAAMTAASDPH